MSVPLYCKSSVLFFLLCVKCYYSCSRYVADVKYIGKIYEITMNLRLNNFAVRYLIIAQNNQWLLEFGFGLL